MSRLVFAAGILLLTSLSVRADDATKSRLDRATQAYDATMKSIHQEIIKNLAAREETARKEGKTELVEQIKADRQALRERDELPAILSPAISKRVAAARETMATAYKAAVKEYLKDKKDAEAKSIDEALTAFRRDAFKHLNIDEATVKDDFLSLKREAFVSPKHEYSGPIEIQVVARTEQENIRLHGYRGSLVIFNWELNPGELRVHRAEGSDERNGGSIARARVGSV